MNGTNMVLLNGRKARLHSAGELFLLFLSLAWCLCFAMTAYICWIYTVKHCHNRRTAISC